MNANPLKSVFKIITISLFVMLLSACQNESYKENVSVADTAVSEEYEAVTSKTEPSTSTIPNNLKIIKSANARYKVKHVKVATKKIKQIALNFDAYISDLRFQNDLYRIENRFTVKVPQQHFDAMMDSISAIVEFVEYENITTQDVTEEYIDIETRLKAKLEVKQRYETILRQKAKTVEEILATEEKLRVIQEEIESEQGRLKYLTNKVAYSTIQIDLYETVDYKEEPTSYKKSFWSKTKEGLVFGWNFIETIVLGIIHIWPFIILGSLLFFVIKKRIKK
ncbi:hypothetical protein DMZ43_10435 [Meridianimaribacter sp. CL38]|uniref:DUF4349 domain-containing protein n=1 Tax=Meridianimaribacter sp. CL38 TaxID=2213021 RepID=UPI00103A01AD|nr:DUF4349 domain-containing protein [Meridianimaribacter sp. CL38]TBV25360.1 hypothetical protein DMZ43_10435 [Meridianimaribacter sp. CL38]